MEWCWSYVFDVKLSFIVELNDNVAQAEIGSLQYYGKVYSDGLWCTARLCPG